MTKEEKLEQLNKLARQYENAQEREDLFLEGFKEQKEAGSGGYFDMCINSSGPRASIYVNEEEACVLYDKLLEMIKDDRKKKYQAYAKMLDECFTNE